MKSSELGAKLYNAIATGEPVENIKYLIDSGADIEYTGRDGTCLEAIVYPAYETYSRDDYREIVRMLIDAGASVNVEHYFTPLYNACNDGGVDIVVVKMLLDAGANIHYEDSADYTIFEVCCDMDIFRVLIDKLIETKSINKTYYGGGTLLHKFALSDWDPEIEKIQMLIDAGIDISAKDNNSRTAWDLVEEYRNKKFRNEVEPLINPAKKAANAPKAEKPGKICSTCGATLPEGAKFCPACGTKTQISCPGCGAEIIQGAKFCMNCGQKLE